MNNSKIFTGADAVLKTLSDHGIDKVFWIPGWAALPIFDKLYENPYSIKYLPSKHEQWSAFKAQWVARSTGKVWAFFATSWPGATNTVTAIADAYRDSIPIFGLTAQVQSHMMWLDAFQEIDIVDMVKKCTKYSKCVKNVDDIIKEVSKAIFIALDGRPWPVLIDIPKDVLLDEYKGEFEYKKDFKRSDFWLPPIWADKRKSFEISTEKMDEAISLLKWASRPVLLVWQWIKFSWAQEELMNFINTLWIPTVPTALGKWVVKSKNKNNLKMLGMHGFVHTNKAVYNADLIMGIGLRFDDRIVGTYEEFWSKAKVIHVDIDQKELGKIVSTNLSIRSDAKGFLSTFQDYYKWGKLNIDTWWKQIHDWDAADPYIVKNDVFWWKQVLKKINEIMDKKSVEDIVTVDVWQHQMWATQIIDIDDPMNWLFSGWLWTMWCSLPFALGAAVSNPNKQVISISWDGGFQMNIQELWVLNEDEWLAENPNIKIMILDNSCLWMVRQWQEKFHDNRLSWVSTRSPNFQKIGEGYNINSYTINNFDEMDQNLEKILSESWPALIWFKIKTEDNVFPMVPPGKTLWA